jgi:signal transduction histidine kinase
VSQDGQADNRVNILVVDDNPSKIVAIRAILESLDQIIVETRSGADALQQLLTNDFAVILLDVLMPEMDGYETAEMIRSHQRSAVTPIIFLTAFDRGETQITRGYGLGAVDFVFAPIVPEVLRAKVSVFVELHKASVERARLVESLRELTGDLEQRVKERTAQLEASNEELAAFSYTVAHDLRAPLRAIDGFSSMLQEKRSDLSPDVAQHYLDMIGRNAVDMGNLIDGLLTFSRLSRQAFQKQNLNPAAVARSAADKLVAGLAGRKVEFDITEMPRCRSDPILLEQVYANLLGNAIKFSRDREVARVEVGYVPADASGKDQPVYYVKDFGIGFDMKHADTVFGVFQRLSGAREFEGTGAGLAIVRRIVQRHGGHAWAEAEPGKGATFYFTLGGS